MSWRREGVLRIALATTCLAVTFSFQAAGLWAGDPVILLPVVPAAANAILVIDVDSLYGSKLAENYHWADKTNLEHSVRPILVPSEASAVAIAAQLDPDAGLKLQWQVSIAQMKKALPLESIARWEGGYVDKISGTDVAWTPSDCYIMELPEQRLALLNPASRQIVSRWLELRQNSSNKKLSDYLASAATLVNDRTQIVMALELKDAIAPHRLKAALEQSQVLFNNQSAAIAVEKLVSGVLGVTLKVNVNYDAVGEFRVDFETTPRNDPVLKPLILEVLNRHGLQLEELDDWPLTVDGNALVLKGKFSPEGLRKVGSLLQLPSTKFADLEGAEPTEPGTPDYTKRSQQYFTAVSSLIDDLNKQLKTGRDNHSVWMERYGKKIDSLPILNVDEELLDWGSMVAETFRDVALEKRSSGIRQGARSASVYGDYYYSDGGYYRNRPVANEKIEIRRQEQATANQMRINSWKDIEDSRADIRRQMTKKYGVEF